MVTGEIDFGQTFEVVKWFNENICHLFFESLNTCSIQGLSSNSQKVFMPDKCLAKIEHKQVVSIFVCSTFRRTNGANLNTASSNPAVRTPQSSNTACLNAASSNAAATWMTLFRTPQLPERRRSECRSYLNTAFIMNAFIMNAAYIGFYISYIYTIYRELRRKRRFDVQQQAWSFYK